jgi:BASS family bile acid:Na+ symporter
MRAVVQDVFQVLLAVLIPLAAFTTGLRAPPEGVGQKRLWRRPGLLGRALLAILVLVPLWVVFLVKAVPLAAGVPGGLLIAAIAVGIGPAAGMKRMGGGTAAGRDALDLNVIVLVLSLVFVPLAFAVLAALFHADLQLGLAPVAKVVLGRALLPVVVGLALARWQPRLAANAGPMLSKILAMALLALVVVALLVVWRQLAGVGARGWAVCFAAALGAVIIGHALGGPDPATRGVIAAASAMRFPALALALAAVFPNAKQVVPAVLVYVLSALVAMTAYGVLMARRTRSYPGQRRRPFATALPRTT